MSAPTWLGGGVGSYSPRGDKGMRLSLADTLRLAWADPDLRQRIIFILFIFGVYALGVHIQVPIPGADPARLEEIISKNAYFGLLNTIGGGGLKRISIFALGLNPYITASIIMQILTAAFPNLKKEMREGGEYARRQQNKRTRIMTLALSFFQGWGILQLIKTTGAIPVESQTLWVFISVVIFWTAGSMFMLWLGEQVTEKGIGNGVSIMIFAGIVISFPSMIDLVIKSIPNVISIFQAIALVALFLATTWFVVMFTIAQRRIPIQHMRRQLGTKMMGGATSYLPLSVNLVGVIPIIFAISLIYMPAQFASMFPANTKGGIGIHEILVKMSEFLNPNFTRWEGWVGCFLYMMLIFFFTYFYTAIQYNVEDIADNLKRGGSFIPGVRPGKQTKDFLDGVISRITVVGAVFLSIVALTQYVVPLIAPIQGLSLLFGTSLLIMVSVALETMRQIEANLLMKQYGGS